jgi:chemotaxis protein MotB
MPKIEALKDSVRMIVTQEGLRIELLEKEGGMFFESGNSSPTSKGREILVLLAGELAKMPNQIAIEGHTDAKPYASTNGYTNWELSADRANMARRVIQEHGLVSGRISQVRGFADQRLRTPEEPENPSNRRVSVIVQYREPPAGAAPANGAGGGQIAAGPETAKPSTAGHGESKAAAPAPAAAPPPAAKPAPAESQH